MRTHRDINAESGPRPVPFGHFARMLLPGGEGWICMLTAYFDDSGTHSDSDVVLWNGLFGHHYQWQYFDELWSAKLANPSPGKEPLRRFHMYDCERGDEEFLGWSRPACEFLVGDYAVDKASQIN